MHAGIQVTMRYPASVRPVPMHSPNIYFLFIIIILLPAIPGSICQNNELQDNGDIIGI